MQNVTPRWVHAALAACLTMTMSTGASARVIDRDWDRVPFHARPVWNLLDRIHQVDRTMMWSGAAVSQGDLAPPTTPGGTSAAEARAIFGVDGSGVRIGIISDSFDAVRLFDIVEAGGGAAVGVANGELPGAGNPFGFTTPVTVLRDDLSPASIDEGRAMAEIIHDLAPGAEIVFHSAFNNFFSIFEQQDDRSIARAIDALVAAECDVIVDDVIFVNTPYFQDGRAAASADAAFAAGSAYFGAAGNNGREAWQGDFTPSFDEQFPFHTFRSAGGIDELLDIDVPSGSEVRVVVQWDDPYRSVGFEPSQQFADFDALLVDTNLLPLDTSTRRQTNGADPFEIVAFANITPSTQRVLLAIQQFSAPGPRELRILVFGGSIVDDDDTNSPTNVGQTAAAGAQAVGAVFWDDGLAESFTAAGPSDIRFASDGTPINDVRAKPDIAATNGVNTSFFAPFALDPSDRDIPEDADDLPNFFGTSAAAPHAAAVAALIIERHRLLLGESPSPAAVYELLAESASPVPNADAERVGAGRIDAVAALELLQPQNELCPGDIDGDLDADGDDFILFLVAFGSTVDTDLSVAERRAAGDLNLDGVVDGDDFIELLLAFGDVCEPS